MIAGYAHTFWQRLLAARGLGEDLLTFRDGLAAETDTLLGVENGALPYQSLYPSRTTIHLIEGDLVDDLGAMLSVRTP